MNKLLITVVFTVLSIVNQSFSQSCSQLIISEYLEGDADNKYLELFNGTSSNINLINYSISIFSNGSILPTYSYNLSGNINTQETYLIAHQNSNLPVTPNLYISENIMTFNGNDAIVLYKNNVAIDIIGEIGNTNIFAKNIDLQRKLHIQEPTVTYDANQWQQSNSNTLNTHYNACNGEYFSFTSELDSIYEDGVSYNLKVVSSEIGNQTVDIKISGGTALNSDYQFNNTTATFISSTEFIVPIFIHNNSTIDRAKTIEFFLENPSNNYSIINHFFTLTILEDDAEMLNTGDLIIIGYDTWSSNTNQDKIVLTNIKEITYNTSFSLFNAVYEYKAAPNISTRRWYNGNANFNSSPSYINIQYKGMEIPPGSIICIELSSGGAIDRIYVNNILSNDFIDDGNRFVQFSASSPDAIFLMSGSFSSPFTDADNDVYLTFSGSVLGGIQSNGTFSNFSEPGNYGGLRVSRIHPHIRCFGISTGSQNNTFYGYYNGSLIGDKSSLINDLFNYQNNWIFGGGVSSNSIDDVNICSNSFTISTSSDTVKWLGYTDNNWFNCENWENQIVPNESTNVQIKNEAANNVLISSSAEYSTEYQNKATCYHLTIEDKTLTIENNTDSIYIYGNLTLNNNSILDMTNNSNGGNLYLSGNWNNNSYINNFQNNYSKVSFIGVKNQTISNPNNDLEYFYDITFNNSENNITLLSDVIIKNSANFINGIIETSSSNRLIFNNGSTVSNASANSYVNGFVHKIGNQAFEFPLGANNLYYPLTISAPLNSSDEFVAEFIPINSDPIYTHLNKEITLDHISICNYWTLNQISGANNLDVSLSFNNPDCEVDNTSELIVTRWNTSDSEWKNEGNKSIIPESALTPGKITANNKQSVFGVYTLASTSSNNPLPVELITFEVNNNEGKAILTWEIATEKNNAYFTIEKSLDGINWEHIEDVNGRGNSVTISSYQTIDNSPYTGLSYYRLSQTDFDGTREVFSPIVFNNDTDFITVYPNPAKNELNITGINENYTINIYDYKGSLILQNINLKKINITELETGIYFIIIYNQSIYFKKKIIVE